MEKKKKERERCASAGQRGGGRRLGGDLSQRLTPSARAGLALKLICKHLGPDSDLPPTAAAPQRLASASQQTRGGEPRRLDLVPSPMFCAAGCGCK